MQKFIWKQTLAALLLVGYAGVVHGAQEQRLAPRMWSGCPPECRGGKSVLVYRYSEQGLIGESQGWLCGAWRPGVEKRGG